MGVKLYAATNDVHRLINDEMSPEISLMGVPSSHLKQNTTHLCVKLVGTRG
jgi:hypothetical protein